MVRNIGSFCMQMALPLQNLCIHGPDTEDVKSGLQKYILLKYRLILHADGFAPTKSMYSWSRR